MMARIRYLKPDFFKDEDIGALPFEVRLFFQGLWGLADKEGRLEDRPMRLKAEIFPYDDVDVSRCLSWLLKPKAGSGLPFIYRYAVEGQRFIQIVTWSKHQKPHGTERGSEIPPYNPPNGKDNGNGNGECNFGVPPLDNGEVTVKEPLKGNGTSRVDKSTPESISPESFLQHWNQYESLPTVRALSKERRSKIIARGKSEVIRDNWKEIVRKLSESPFHTGSNDRGWRATVDWLLKNDENCLKILELPELMDGATGPIDEDDLDRRLGVGQ